MMKLFIVIVLLGYSFAYAQVLDNRRGEAFTDRPFFNTDFIKTNKIKCLNGTFTYKKDGDIMRPTEYKHVYQFDREGQLESSYETRQDDGSEDTTWNRYKYDNRGNLIAHQKTDLEGFLTIHYTYDSLDRVIHEKYTRDVDSNGTIVRSLIFNEEKLEHKTYDRQRVSTRYNNHDLPYLDEFQNFNELGYLVSVEERVKMTSAVNTFSYEYNREGKLASIKKTSNRREGIIEEMRFEYDELGNLTQKHLYRNGTFTTDIQIIYNSKSKLLSSVLTRQVSTGFILILRFANYEFYD